MTLEEMISISSAIVLGKVSNVTVLEPFAAYPIKIAEVEVIEVLKGDKAIKNFYYWASPGKACDVTTAIVGKTDVFMFQPGTRFRDFPKSLSTLLPKIKEATGNSELVKIVHQGRGRLEIRKISGAEYVVGNKTGEELIFPSSLRLIDYPDPEYSYVGMVEVGDLLTFIKDFLRK
jgi:hypothetical protein